MVNKKAKGKGKLELYDSVHKLPYIIFKEVLIEENLELLVVSGTPDKPLLSSTWDEIITAYNDATASSLEDKLYWFTFREYLQLKRKQQKELYLIELLQFCYVELWAKELYKSLLKPNGWMALNTEDRAAYNTELEKCRTRTKNIHLNLKELELEALQKKREAKINNEDCKPSYDKFITTENNLEIYFKVHFDFEKMKLAKFIDLIKRYGKAVEEFEKTKRK